MAQRLTYRRRLSYNTKSNRVRVIKTPGRLFFILKGNKYINNFLICYYHI